MRSNLPGEARASPSARRAEADVRWDSRGSPRPPSSLRCWHFPFCFQLSDGVREHHDFSRFCSVPACSARPVNASSRALTIFASSGRRAVAIRSAIVKCRCRHAVAISTANNLGCHRQCSTDLIQRVHMNIQSPVNARFRARSDQKGPAVAVATVRGARDAVDRSGRFPPRRSPRRARNGCSGP